MKKFLLTMVLVTAFSASALAELEKATTRAHQRYISQSTSVHPWRQMREHKPDYKSGNSDDFDWHREYWEPCNSTFREYIVNGCDSN